MEKIKRLCWVVLTALMKIYVHNVEAPWLEARFYSSWEEYQQSQVYRERMTGLGFQYTFKIFLEDKGEQKYYLRMRETRKPMLKFQRLFTPFTIPIPDILEIAGQSGAI